MRIKLQKSLFLLPNLLTLSSLLCGFYAISLCTDTADELDFQRAALFIVYAMLFDTIDGRVARITRTQSALGMQLDSLVDAISFGVAPALLVYRWSLHALGWAGLFCSFIFLACATIRLARFNVLSMDASGRPKKASKYVVGLPAPGAAGILVSLVSANQVIWKQMPGSPIVVLLLVISLSVFMVGTIRFRSFKDLTFSWKTLFLVFCAIVPSIILAIQFHISVALIWLLGAYVVVGVVESVVRTSKRVISKAKDNSEDNGSANREISVDQSA